MITNPWVVDKQEFSSPRDFESFCDTPMGLLMATRARAAEEWLTDRVGKLEVNLASYCELGWVFSLIMFFY